MPKEFSQWQAEMANSIEDKSHFIKPCACGAASTPVKLSEYKTIMQRRMSAAYAIAGSPTDSEQAERFLSVLCLKIDDEGEFYSDLSLLKTYNTNYQYELLVASSKDAYMDIVDEIIAAINKGDM